MRARWRVGDGVRVEEERKEKAEKEETDMCLITK